MTVGKKKVEKVTSSTSSNKNGVWQVTKEKILFGLGVVLIIFEYVNAEVLNRPFHIEFLIAALALCGVSIAQWGDKR